MTKEQLTERIEKANLKLAKIQRRINKWQESQNREGCIKHYEYLINWGKPVKDILDNYYEDYLNTCSKEIDRAQRELEEVKLLLDKYNNLLNLEKSKDDQFENNRIMVIWDFLLKYKDQVAEFIRNNMDVLNEYYEVNSQLCDWHNHNSYKVRNGEMTREHYMEVERELREKEKELSEGIHPYTRIASKRNWSDENSRYTVDEDKLEEILLKDCKARYFELVNEVTKYTGIITDATNLRIKAGELNGIIIGEKGKAKVLTFSAGGYNIQCFHYRTKVSEVK